MNESQLAENEHIRRLFKYVIYGVLVLAAMMTTCVALQPSTLTECQRMCAPGKVSKYSAHPDICECAQ